MAGNKNARARKHFKGEERAERARRKRELKRQRRKDRKQVPPPGEQEEQGQ